jgi:hypothetical protein
MRLMSSAGAETMNTINLERTKKLKVVVQILRILGPKNSFVQFKKNFFLKHFYKSLYVFSQSLIVNPQYLS